MNYGKELNQVDISKAIELLTNTVFKNQPKEKVMVVNICFDVSNYKLKNSENVGKTELNLVIYRPHNYTFIGVVKDSNLTKDSEIEFVSYHSSCWRDGIDRAINKITNKIYKNIEGKEGYHIFNSFGVWGTNVIENAAISINSSDRVAKFFRTKKEEKTV